MFEETEEIQNAREHAVRVVFEPWGEPYELPAKASLRVVSRCEEPHDFEVERRDEAIVVYAAPRSRIEVRHANRVVYESAVRAPRLPSGMTRREYARRMWMGDPVAGGRS